MSFARATQTSPGRSPATVPAPAAPKTGKGCAKPRANTKGRPEVITVTPPEGVSFLDIFRKVRQVKEVEDCVRKGSRILRDTAEMLLKRNVDAKAVFQRVKELAPKGSKVTLRLDTVRLQLRGIDMLAERGDVAKAMSGKVGEEIPEEDVTLQRYNRGDQRAFVRVPRRIANALLGERLVFGYTSCRVELAPPKPIERTNCGRCLLKGHLARSCKGPDRSARCRKCGCEGHKAAACSNKEKCLECGGPHTIGSAQCKNRHPNSQ
uniref:CCHC-type domain-containing protein n=1 Tax=Anopheles atroparvus TaxID=41427 RepID=A0A182IYF7_ANOAO